MGFHHEEADARGLGPVNGTDTGPTLDWTPIPLLVALGCLVGFLAGLLGVGGAMTIIPVLTIVFAREHFPPEHLIHMAVATSMARCVPSAS